MAYKMIIWHGTEFTLPSFPEQEVLVIKFDPHRIENYNSKNNYGFTIPDASQIDPNTVYILHIHGGRVSGTYDDDPVHDTFSNGYVAGGENGLDEVFIECIVSQHKKINKTDFGPAIHISSCFASHAAIETAKTLNFHHDGTTVYLQAGFKECCVLEVDNILNHIYSSHDTNISTMQSRFDAFYNQLKALPYSVTMVQGTLHPDESMFYPLMPQDNRCSSIYLGRFFPKTLPPIDQYQTQLKTEWAKLVQESSNFRRIHDVKLPEEISVTNIVDFDSKIGLMGKKRDEGFTIKYMLDHVTAPTDLIYIVKEILEDNNCSQFITEALSHPLFDPKTVLASIDSMEFLFLLEACDKSHPSTMKLAGAILQHTECLKLIKEQDVPRMKHRAIKLVSDQEWSEEFVLIVASQLDSMPRALSIVVEQIKNHPSIAIIEEFVSTHPTINDNLLTALESGLTKLENDFWMSDQGQ